MRLPRSRFTLRWLMVAIAIVACLLWCERMWRISLKHQQTANRFAGRAVVCNILVSSGGEPETPEEIAVVERNVAEWQREEDARQGRVKDYYAAMASKYRRAARYPWLPVAPDPPEPQ